MEITHLCAIKRRHSGTYLQPLSPDASWRQRFLRKFRTWTLVYNKHPKCIEYFKSATGLRKERKRHATSPFVYIIHPFSKLRLYYEMYMAAIYVIVFSIMFVDLDISNELRVPSILYEIICLFGCADIIITFFTGYATPSRDIVFEPKKIAINYICSIYLLTDMMAFLPVKYVIWFWDLDERDSAETAVDMLRFVIIFRLYTLDLYMKNTAEYFGMKIQKIFVVIRYTIIIYVLVLYFGAMNYHIPRFRMIGSSRRLDKTSWLRQTQFEDTWGKYVITLFKSSSFLLGASKAITDLKRWEEIFTAIVTYIFGRFYTILLTVQILHMMTQYRMLDTKYSRIRNQLEEYMTYKTLPKLMRKRLRQYYDYKYQKKFFREEVITSTLSDGLKREIKVQVCRKLVTNVTLFAGLSAQTVSDIIEYLRLEVYLPNDPIIKAGDPGDCMYLLSTGTVAVYTASGRELCHLNDGAYFGEISLLFKDQLRTANVIAVEICEVYSLSRTHFKKYFLSHERLYQKLYQTAEDRFEMLLMVEEMYKKK